VIEISEERLLRDVIKNLDWFFTKAIAG